MYGRSLLSQNSVFPTRVSADGNPQYKAGGVTIDWSTITAPGTDTTLTDGSIIKSGLKFLRYGQVITKITVAGTDVVTINGSPTGGTFAVSVTTTGGPSPSTQTTAGIAYNASAATLQTAIRGLSNVGGTLATVTGSSGGPFTIVFDSSLGTVTVTSDGALLTGGTAPTATTASTSDNNVGWFGPYDPSAADGRQTLTRGECYVLDETLVQYAAGANNLSPSQDQVGGAIEGGLVYIDRILQAGSGSHTLAAGPTKTELLAAFPSLRIVEN